MCCVHDQSRKFILFPVTFFVLPCTPLIFSNSNFSVINATKICFILLYIAMKLLWHNHLKNKLSSKQLSSNIFFTSSVLPAITQGYLAKYSPIQLTSSSWDEQWLLFVCIYYRSICGRWAARRHGLSHCAPPWGETMIAAFLAAPLRARLHQDILMQMKAGGGGAHTAPDAIYPP